MKPASLFKASALLLCLLSAQVCGAQQAALPYAKCFKSAATHFNVEKRLLVAIAQTESSLNPKSMGPRNANGSYDIGMMQINSFWLPTLSKLGISEATLKEPCTNIHVGAWILAQNINRHGPTWKAVGAYNAVTPSKQVAYVTKVQRNYQLVASLLNS